MKDTTAKDEERFTLPGWLCRARLQRQFFAPFASDTVCRRQGTGRGREDVHVTRVCTSPLRLGPGSMDELKLFVVLRSYALVVTTEWCRRLSL